MWKDVEGYDGRYQVSYYGKVRSVYGSGKTKNLVLYPKHQRNNGLIVRLSKNRIRKEYFVHTLVARAFLGEPPKGFVTYHKNGILTDNIATNLRYATRQELGRLTGGKSNRRPVAKLDNKGEVVEFYASARAAEKDCYLSYQTIVDRCNGKVKSAFGPDGYGYAWDDCDLSMRIALEKIRKLI